MACQKHDQKIHYIMIYCTVFVFQSPTVMTISYRHAQDKLSIFTGIHSSIIKYLRLRLDISFIHFYHTKCQTSSSNKRLTNWTVSMIQNTFHCKITRAHYQWSNLPRENAEATQQPAAATSLYCYASLVNLSNRINCRRCMSHIASHHVYILLRVHPINIYKKIHFLCICVDASTIVFVSLVWS